MIDDNNLGSSSRALLDAARPALGPDGDAQRRMRAKIAASVGGAGAAAGAAAVKSGLAAKIGLASLALLVGIGAIVVATRRGDDGAAPTIGLPHSPAGSLSPATHESVEMPGSAHHVEREPRREEEMPAIDARPHPVGRASVPAVVAPKKISLAREVELVDRAMAALKSRDYAGAIAAVHDHDVESAGAGQLAEDASAIAVEAYCKSNAADARTRLASFDRHYPSSAQHARLEEACK